MLLFHEVCHSSKIYLLIDGLKLENGILKEVGSNESAWKLGTNFLNFMAIWSRSCGVLMQKVKCIQNSLTLLSVCTTLLDHVSFTPPLHYLTLFPSTFFLIGVAYQYTNR